MKIALAQRSQLHSVQKYDRHIPEDRLAACIDGKQVYVLQTGNAIVGVLRYSLFWQTMPFLDLIYIDEAWRSQGYGRRMMEHWETAMAELGFRYVMLSTQEDETAKYFYEKLGCRRIGSFLPPEQEADELIYLKEIPV